MRKATHAVHREPAIDPHLFAEAIDALRHRAGLIFPKTRFAGLESAIQRVMRGAKVSTLAELLALIDAGGPPFDDLVAAATVGESYFFREPAQFEVIRQRVLPELLSTAPRRRIRAWSAAASTGEEAFSLAILFREQGVHADVVATDLSRARLQVAAAGSYRQWSFRGVPQSTIDRWFTRDGDRFTLDKRLRDSVDFRYLNLAEDSYPSMASGVWGMDLILCRNVLIYFDAPTIARVASRLLDSLGEDGWLMLGASDPPIADLLAVDVVDTPAGIAYRKAREGRLRRPTAPPAPASNPTRPIDDVTPPETPAELASAVVAVGTPSAFTDPSAVADHEAIVRAYAARDYTEVVRLGDSLPNHTTAARLILFIRALANLGQLDRAGRVCATALDLYRDAAELHYLHAILLMEGGRPAEAAVAARRALYLDRGLVVAHLALATACSRTGDTAGSRRALGAADRLLTRLPADAIVPGSDGESAAHLMSICRTQHRLVTAAV